MRRISMFRAKALHLELLALVTADEGPSLETSKFSSYFSGSCIPTNESLFIILAKPIAVLGKKGEIYSNLACNDGRYLLVQHLLLYRVFKKN
jgi:hypothetical protein